MAGLVAPEDPPVPDIVFLLMIVGVLSSDTCSGNCHLSGGGLREVGLGFLLSLREASSAVSSDCKLISPSVRSTSWSMAVGIGSSPPSASPIASSSSELS